MRDVSESSAELDDPAEGKIAVVAGLQRTLLTIVGLTVMAAVTDAHALLTPAGRVLSIIEVLGLIVLSAISTFAVRRDPRPVHFAAPLAGLVAFRSLAVPFLDVPADAVLRDAQAGLAVAVVLIAQLCVVGLGFGLGRGKPAASSASASG